MSRRKRARTDRASQPALHEQDYTEVVIPRSPPQLSPGTSASLSRKAIRKRVAQSEDGDSEEVAEGSLPVGDDAGADESRQLFSPVNSSLFPASSSASSASIAAGAPLFEENLGQPDPEKDKFCFWCDHGIDETSQQFREIMECFDRVGQFGVEWVCKAVFAVYNAHIRPEVPGNPPWTMLGIRRHVLEHHELMPKQELKMLARSNRKVLRLITENLLMHEAGPTAAAAAGAAADAGGSDTHAQPAAHTGKQEILNIALLPWFYKAVDKHMALVKKMVD